MLGVIVLWVGEGTAGPAAEGVSEGAGVGPATGASPASMQSSVMLQQLGQLQGMSCRETCSIDTQLQSAISGQV